MAEKPAMIITGASRGVGAAAALWAGRIGAAVTLVARTGDPLEAVAAAVTNAGGRVVTVCGDVSDPDTCSRAVAATLERFGRLDALVNNAGILSPLAYTADADPASWRYNIEVNLLGPYFLAAAAVKHLRRRQGRIVNVSSGASHTVIQGAGAYCAAKAALTHFTRILAAEEPQITCVSVRPGVVDTQMQAMLRQSGPGAMPPEQAAFYRDLHRQGRLEPPEIPGRSIVWLALAAPRPWSGRFLNYDDPEILQPAVDMFGEMG